MIQKTSTVEAYHNFLKKILGIVVVLLNILAAGIVGFSLYNSRTHYEEEAAVATRNITNVLDENLSGIFKKIDIALEAVREEAEHLLASGGIQAEILDNYIFRQQSRLPELLALRATNAVGNAVYGPKGKIATTTSLAHRNYFQLLRDNPNAGLVISKPLIGGISGQWMIILARRINRPDGTFAGLTYAGLGIDYLTQKFKHLNVGTNGSITLLDGSLCLIARYPASISQESEIGKRVGSKQLLDLIESGKTSETYPAISSIDRVERIFSFSKLSLQQPYYIVTGLSSAEYLSKWWIEVAKMVLLWALFSVASIVSTILLGRGWKRIAKLEEKVLKGEQRFRVFIENANDLIYTLSSKGIITYVAPNLESLLGYHPDEFIGKSFRLFIHQEDFYAFEVLLSNILESKLKQTELEYRIRHKQNKWLWFISNASSLTDIATGEPSFLAIGHEITNRKQAEENLRESEQWFRAMFDKARDVILVVDTRSRRCFMTNEMATSMLGYNREELLQLSIKDLHPPEALAYVQEQFDLQTAQKIGIALDLPMQRKDGTVWYADVSAFPINIKSSTYQMGIFRDITTRKRAEEELKSIRDRLEMALNGANLGTWDWNIKTGALHIDTQCAAMLGYRLNEIEPTLQFGTELIHPDDLTIVQVAWNNYLGSKTSVYRSEHRVRHKSKKWIWILSMGKITEWDAEGKPERACGIRQDITEIKQAELEKRLLNPNPVLELDLNGTITFYNEGAVRACQRLETNINYLLPQDLGNILKAIKNKDEKEFYREVQVKSTIFGEHIYYSPQLQMICLFATDITEGKVAEEAFRESEEKYRTLFESSSEGILLMKDVFLDCNAQACRVWACQKEDIIGHTPAEFSPEYQPDGSSSEKVAKELIQKALAGEAQSFYWQHQRKDEVVIDTEVSLNKVTVAGSAMLLAGVRDITQRKRAEELLKESEERLQLALQGADLGMWDWNITTGKVIFDSRWVEMLGYSMEEIEPHVSFWEKIVHSEDMPQIQKVLNDHLMGRIPNYETEHRLLTKSGEWVWVLDKGKVTHRNQAEQPLRAVGTHLDITGRKKAEEQIHKSLQEKEVLLKEIHHRVKNNLQIISGLLELQSRKSDNPQVVVLLKDLQLRISSMALVHEALYRSKDLATINLKEYLTSLLQSLFTSYLAIGSKVRLTSELENITINIDTAIPCGLIISELLSNSFKYGFPNGRVGTVNLRMSLIDNEQIELLVSDDGIGISPDFDFNKINSLGLKLVRDLVELQMNGKINLIQDKGTKFQIIFKEIKYKKRV